MMTISSIASTWQAALGEFDVQEGTDVLLKAAKTNRDPREERMRDTAIQAIAVRAYNLQRLKPPVEFSSPELETNLNQLASDGDARIRSQTAYALGQLGTPAAIERLEGMVADPDADTRYNAAVALAHRGNPKAIETLAEMLELDELAGVREEQNTEGKKFKRTVIIVSAIDATHALAQEFPSRHFARYRCAQENCRRGFANARESTDLETALSPTRNKRSTCWQLKSDRTRVSPNATVTGFARIRPPAFPVTCSTSPDILYRL